MRKASNQDTDGTAWDTAPLSLGPVGLDLRKTGNQSALAVLNNARFPDPQTVERREGHTGRALQDQTSFHQDKRVEGWVYGHGTQITIPGDNAWQDEHHPVHLRGGGTFSYGDTNVAWTGDRLLVATQDGPFVGGSEFWARGLGGVSRYGIPAYLPVQIDWQPPVTTYSAYMDTCLTSQFRLLANTNSGGFLEATIIDRETGVVLDQSVVGGEASGTAFDIRAINSAGVMCLVYRNGAGLQVSHWSGGSWSSPSVIDAAADCYDTAVTASGFHVVWRVAAELFAGKFSGSTSVDTPYAFGSGVFTGDTTPSGHIAVSVSAAGEMALVWEASAGLLPAGLYTIMLDINLSVPWDTTYALSASTAAWDGGLTVAHRGLMGSLGTTEYVVYACQTDSVTSIVSTSAWEVTPRLTSDPTVKQSGSFHSSSLCSKAFTVGTEVLVWLHTLNSDTNYLVAGVDQAQRCGIADRETAIDAPATSSVRWLTMVHQDPLDSDRLMTWMRPFNSGSYNRPGNSKVGDMDFLPELSYAKFGKGVYLAGSHVRCWDGIELGDAGFHDYPIIKSHTASNSTGALTNSGTYYIRVYARRYTSNGEKFLSPAVTSTLITMGAADDTIALVVRPIPVTNHDNVVLEVYRTESGGTTFYLETTVTNSRSAATVSVNLVLSDAALILKEADPHAPTVDLLVELEEFGPLGCSTLVTAGDRLWASGGQTGSGVAQFSKLWEPGEGAGFDSLGGNLQTVDATGGELTSLAAFTDTVVVAFQANRFYALHGDGPNNYGVGAFQAPQLVLEDGATNHAGTISVPGGIAFWGAGGPRFLTEGFQVLNISEPVRPLSETLSPTGARVDLARREVIWYTSSGDALLWNFQGGKSRWARWTGLPVAGCSDTSLVTTSGRLLTPSSTPRDDGRRFVFELQTGNMRPEQVMLGHTLLRRVGLSGEFHGEHSVRFKVFYDGSRLWTQRFKWSPTTDTWLVTGSDMEDLTPAQIDALANDEQAGAYGTHHRLQRETCRYFSVAISDGGDYGFTPWELAFELGQKPGLGRTPVNTFE